ncbi:hypothetical protein [Pantoea sp. App145]|uniref:hypothetical protein n=1 Tax=Pantoea sp. App145 TaxID=3071567 RepID=UPI003A805047
MSISSISASPGAVARDSVGGWGFADSRYETSYIRLGRNIINYDIDCTSSITLFNCYVGVKHTAPSSDEAVYSYQGDVEMNNCTIKGVVNTPNGYTRAKDSLIIGKISGSIAPILLTTTEIRSQDYIKIEGTSQPGFGAWINDIKDSDDAIYQFNLTDVDYYKSMLAPEANIDFDSLTHLAILSDESNIECCDGCKIYGDIINHLHYIEDYKHTINIIKSSITGSIINRAGDTLLEQASAKTVYTLAGVTEINNSALDFIYTEKSDTRIHNHSVIRQGAILGGQNNEILSSTINGSLKLLGQTLTMRENSVVDQVCLPSQEEARGDFIPCITLESGSVLNALKTHGQPCRIRIGEGATFTLLINPEIIPANVEIIYL